MPRWPEVGDDVRVYWDDIAADANAQMAKTGTWIAYNDGEIVDITDREVKLRNGLYPDCPDQTGDYVTIPLGCVREVYIKPRFRDPHRGHKRR